MDRLTLACFDWALDRNYQIIIDGQLPFGVWFAIAIIAVAAFALGHLWATDGVTSRSRRKQ